ncbi:MAG TPA: AI-2E family transporter [Clostridia bacterium]|jgi:predicted PurR-regulated permease PerM|nr:AI-2E family transporter [Clostridia bacterium]HPY42866.1 AI-2E family transporter [Clostridia bacterium]HQA97290.1 AI-2E family transporter [Clostridia bacterium]HUM61011.1 AI-2E family transporter [Clostridia bacterium]
MWQDRKRWLPLAIGLMLLAFALYRFDAIITLFKTLLSILTPFIMGLFMALLINLPLRLLERVIILPVTRPALQKMRRAITLSLSVLIVGVVIALLLIVIIPEVSGAVERLIRVIPGLLKDLELWLTERNANVRQTLGLAETNEGEVRDIFQRAYQFLVGGLSYSSGVVISAAGFLVNLVVGLVFAIYLLFSKEVIQNQFSRLLRSLLPPRVSRRALEISRMLIRAYTNFLGGQLLQAFISSVLTTLVLIIFGFPYAVLIGLITFVSALIPVFGPFISGVLGMLLVLTVSPSQTLWFLLAFFIVQQLSGSVIYPRIMSNAIDIPSIWVLVAVTLGGGIMGIPGMLLFIPLTAVAFHLVSEYVSKKEQAARGTEQHIDTL